MISFFLTVVIHDVYQDMEEKQGLLLLFALGILYLLLLILLRNWAQRNRRF